MNEYELSLAFRASPAQKEYIRHLGVTQLPSISIVIPSFNQAKYIGQALDSVFTQGYPDLEVYVADGGSSDETASILDEYVARYPGLLKYDSRPDGGHYHGVNKGISATKGEIIGWLNSDDLYVPDALWTVATFFVFNVSALIAYGRNDYVKENLELLNEYPVDWSPMLSEQRKRMWNFCIVGQPSLFFRRDAVKLCGALNHKLLDYELWLRWQKDLPFFFIDQKLSLSRLQPNAITVNAGRELLTGILKLVRQYYGLAPMPWCIRAAYNRRYGADWTEGKSSAVTVGLKQEARWLWLRYNFLEQPLKFLRMLFAEPRIVISSFREG